MGDTRDFAMALAALVEAFGVKDFSPVRVRTYEDGLKDVPIPLLNAAVRKAIATRTFMPKVSEIRQDAEACRGELIAQHKFSACESCNETGWATVLVDGIERVKRCECFQAHQAKLASLGVTNQPLALPPADHRRYDGDEAA